MSCCMDLKSTYPFWPVELGLVHTYPPLEDDLTCDVVVIGGGITGALVAYHLVEAGFDTVVLDKRDIGWGSTSATTGLLQYEIDTPLHELIEMVGEDHAVRSYQACLQAINKIERLIEALGEPCAFQRKQSLFLASRRRDVKALQTEYDARRKLGIQLDWLTEHDIAACFSFSRPAALLSHDAAQLNAYQMTHVLLMHAMQRGLRVFDRTAVTKVQSGDDGVKLDTDRACTVRARKVVFASGYETQTYLKHPVAKLISTFALVSEPLASFEGWYEQCLIWESSHPYLYLRTTTDGRVMMGGEDEDFRDPIRRDRLIGRKTKKLHDKFRKLFPRIEMEVAFAWAGTFGETKDGLAYIGEAPEWPNAYFALGYGGNGITYSVLAAEIIRDALLNRPNEHADLFRFDR